MKRFFIMIVILLISATAFFTAGCGDPELKSKWLDREIIIDGLDDEWGHFIQYYHKKKRIILCFFNDNRFLYIKISSPDRMTMHQIIGPGMTVWFDPNCGKKKRFGIHFPCKMKNDAINMIRSGNTTGRRKNPDQLMKFAEEINNRLEIISPEKSGVVKLTTTEAEAYGIEVKIGVTNAQLIYELKVPLNKSELTPYAISENSTGTIGIGFETGKMEAPKFREGEEEIWIALKGEILVQMGDKRRSFPAGSAYKVPPDGRTPHININSSNVSQKLLWMMKVPLVNTPPGSRSRSYKDVI